MIFEPPRRKHFGGAEFSVQAVGMPRAKYRRVGRRVPHPAQPANGPGYGTVLIDTTIGSLGGVVERSAVEKGFLCSFCHWLLHRGARRTRTTSVSNGGDKSGTTESRHPTELAALGVSMMIVKTPAITFKSTPSKEGLALLQSSGNVLGPAAPQMGMGTFV